MIITREVKYTIQLSQEELEKLCRGIGNVSVNDLLSIGMSRDEVAVLSKIFDLTNKEWVHS